MKVIKTMGRVYVNDMNSAVVFYETLCGEKCGVRFTYDEMGLELAGVGNLLLIAGTDEALAPFRGTSFTMRVDSLEEVKEYLLANGAVIERDVRKVPTGFNMTARHADGTTVEYVEFA
ncbi:MAG TPA: VOC family protein [Spirochaetota bacterium]|mgnify:CR=1 FL=1|nr:VOC family protein [Spirochaetota bacterium]